MLKISFISPEAEEEVKILRQRLRCPYCGSKAGECGCTMLLPSMGEVGDECLLDMDASVAIVEENEKIIAEIRKRVIKE